MYDAILFDLDGTLIDTESVALDTGLEAFATLGQSVDEGFMHALVGRAGPDADAVIRAAFPDMDHAAFAVLWREGFHSRIAAGVPLKPGARDLLAAIRQPMAIVTSSGREGAHWKIDRAGLAGHFATIVTFDDVAAPKPAPDPYLLAAQRLGVAASACLAFEDSDIGAASAQAAGCTVVQVPDVKPTDGRHARHLSVDLLTGARAAGLL